jgi:hypothetical protein
LELCLTVSVFQGHFTFTSPSLYLANGTLSASAECGTEGLEDRELSRGPEYTDRIFTASVIPLNPEDLHSVVPVFPGYEGNEKEYVQKIATGYFHDELVFAYQHTVEAFQLSHLHNFLQQKHTMGHS